MNLVAVPDSVSEDTIKEYLTPSKTKGEISDEQYNFFLNQCVTMNLNPFKREVYAVPFWNSSTRRNDLMPVTSYTVYLARANQTKKLDGWEIDIEKDDNGSVVSGTITIYRKDRERPLKRTVDFDEIAQKKKDGEYTQTRKTKPKFMTKKVLIGQGMRLAFPEEMSSLPYEESEIDSRDVVDGQIVEPQKEETKPTVPKAAQAPAEIKPPTTAPITDSQLKYVVSLCEKTGYPEKDIKDFVKSQYGVDSRKDLSKSQASKLIKELIDIVELQFKSGKTELSKEDIETIRSKDEKTKNELLAKLEETKK